MPSVKSEPAVENCYNCGRIIGRLETPMVFQPSANRWHIVCKECHQRLTPATPPQELSPGQPSPAATPAVADLYGNLVPAGFLPPAETPASTSPGRAAIEARVRAIQNEEDYSFAANMAFWAVIALALGGIIMGSLSSGRHGVHNSGAEAFGIGFLTIGSFLLLGAFLSWIIRASTRAK